jgi:hypothetical protein
MIYRFRNHSSVTSHPNALHLMFFAGRVCLYRTEGDTVIHETNGAGFGQRPGNVSTASSSGGGGINSTRANNVSLATRIVQHEWSHNYGALDWESCQTACIMTGTVVFTDILQSLNNVWCTRCREVILGNRARLGQLRP